MYIGRFAPSPTGPLHAGSLTTALASWLDARAHGGRWLLRIEDVDTARCLPGADQIILEQLAACGLIPDEPPVWQSQRTVRYQDALERLVATGSAYPCACSRRDVARAQAQRGIRRVPGRALPYPGTCRPEQRGLTGKPPRAWRFHTQTSGRDSQPTTWTDRRLGARRQDVAATVGDFVLRRADGLWAYQLAVVVDDAAQGITHVVRGEDLADNTPRQILLQQTLGLPTPTYMHAPLVCNRTGAKLSKQSGAPAIDLSDPVLALARAAERLGLPVRDPPGPIADLLNELVRHWQALWP